MSCWWASFRVPKISFHKSGAGSVCCRLKSTGSLFLMVRLRIHGISWCKKMWSEVIWSTPWPTSPSTWPKVEISSPVAKVPGVFELVVFVQKVARGGKTKSTSLECRSHNTVHLEQFIRCGLVVLVAALAHHIGPHVRVGDLCGDVQGLRAVCHARP